MEIDLTTCRAYLSSSPALLFATVSGAHLYGFDSPDSDVDLRGASVLPLRKVLGLIDPEETSVITEVRDGVEIDLVTHDIRKFARMMTGRNGYVLEQLFSPLVVVGGQWLEELREIGRGCIVRHVLHHYRGFAGRQMSDVEKPEGTVKDLLYAYRVLLTGLHALRTGQIEANLRKLNADARLDGVDELIARKASGTEKQLLEEDDRTTHLPLLQRLDADLEQAFEASALPDEPTTFHELSDFVVRARLALGQSDG